jgi:hypothetical protein
MTEHALDAITLVPRERVCDHNRDPALADRKIVDVDVYVAGQQRGTWRYSTISKDYGLYVELLDGSGAMTFAEPFGGGSATADTLKAATADLLVGGKLPTRRRYFERRVMVLLIDNKLKIAAVLAVGLGYWLLR